jgi:hypothetical protein
MNKQPVAEDVQGKAVKVKRTEPPDKRLESGPASESAIGALQHQAGNQAVQRLLLQRSGDGPFELDEDTAGRIDRERGGGQAIDSAVGEQMSAALGQDFSGVRVHTSPAAHDLSRQLSANAFTTGNDIFFRQGTYQPHTTGGRELLAHELTHVIQQGAGRVGGEGGGMTVNAPGDAFEQEADAVAASVMRPDAGQQQPVSPVQRQELPEEEELPVQTAPEEMLEEEELPA